MTTEPQELAVREELDQVAVLVPSAAGQLNKSEVEAQLDAAHRYPRQVTRFLRDAATQITTSEEIARSCMYAVKRDGKMIPGPSVRLAEIAASAFGNLHVAARIIGEEEKQIVAQGVAWDLERNLRVSVEVRRRITKKDGRRYSDDMVTMTGNAAASIALRNAIFRVIPRAFIDRLYHEAKKVAIGEQETLNERRAAILEKLALMGAPTDHVLAALEISGVADLGLEHLEVLAGMMTSVQDGTPIEEVFPAPSRERGKLSVEQLREKKEPPTPTDTHQPPGAAETAEPTKTSTLPAEAQEEAPGPTGDPEESPGPSSGKGFPAGGGRGVHVQRQREVIQLWEKQGQPYDSLTDWLKGWGVAGGSIERLNVRQWEYLMDRLARGEIEIPGDLGRDS